MRTGKVSLVALTVAGAVAAGGVPAFAATTVTVAADGSGNYRTVQAAIDAAPTGNAAATR